LNVVRLQTFLPLNNLEPDFLSFAEAFETAPYYGFEMNKKIRGIIIRRDKSETFRIIEPLHRTFSVP